MESPSFLDHLRISGLMTEDQIAEVNSRCSKGDLHAVVSDLIDRGVLTPFQVKQLHAGQPRGLVLGQYTLLDELGRGGYGCVYKTRHKLMDRIVALKVIAPERVEDSHARAWFRREVLAATQLAHPNIVLAYDADEIDGVLFFAMEYIDGVNLDTLVRKRGPLPIGTACEMLLQTAKALQYAHEKGMVHRDIKPANLLIPRGTIAEAASEFTPQSFAGSARPVLVKVVDFGLARLQSSSASNTLVLQSERGFVGTPAYVSPEQARNIHQVDIRSDLYSLGCTFYHALAGREPFRASTPLQIVVQHLEKEPEPIERLRREIPSSLASILRRLMAKKPAKRFQTPAELLGELGFFYSLDRSGLQRSMPSALPDPVRSLQSDPSYIEPTAEPGAPAEAVDVESEYPLTRIMSWSEEAKPSLDSADEDGAPNPSAAVPPSSLAPSVYAATALFATLEVAAPAAHRAQDADDADPGAADRDLVRHWQQWLGVIDDLSAGRAPRLSDAEYRALHRHLLDACKAPAADPGQAALHQQVAELAQPWLTLASIEATDRETLASLQVQCHAMSARLGHVSDGMGTWMIRVFLLVLAAGTCYYLIQIASNSYHGQITAWSGWIQRNPLLSLAIVLPALLLAAALVLTKILRASGRN